MLFRSKMIFSRLYQAEQASGIKQKGLGLGLYICERLVSLHGGRIWLESQLGSGSRFYFTLPIFKETDENLEDKRENLA